LNKSSAASRNKTYVGRRHFMAAAASLTWDGQV
jgi:hypothetical protein